MGVDLQPIAVEPHALVGIWLFMMWPALLLSALVAIFVMSALRSNSAEAKTRSSAAVVLVLTVLLTGIMPTMQAFGLLESRLESSAASLPVLSLAGLSALLVNAGSIIYFSSSMGGRLLTTADWQHLGTVFEGARTTLTGITRARDKNTDSTIVDAQARPWGGTVMQHPSGKSLFASMRLIVGQGVGAMYDIASIGETRIGRDAGLNDIVISDARVSAQHASVKAEKNGFTIYDLGSGNGTFVNGIKVEGSRQLASGDRIQMGDTALLLQIAEG